MPAVVSYEIKKNLQSESACVKMPTWISEFSNVWRRWGVLRNARIHNNPTCLVKLIWDRLLSDSGKHCCAYTRAWPRRFRFRVLLRLFFQYQPPRYWAPRRRSYQSWCLHLNSQPHQLYFHLHNPCQQRPQSCPASVLRLIHSFTSYLLSLYVQNQLLFCSRLTCI